MSTSRKAENVLERANELVNGDRQDVYGDPHTNHQRIADLWNAYLRGSPNDEITPVDAAVMMMLVKVGRIMHTSGHYDNWVDIAGYAQVGYWCAEGEKDVCDAFVDGFDASDADAYWDAARKRYRATMEKDDE